MSGYSAEQEALLDILFSLCLVPVGDRGEEGRQELITAPPVRGAQLPYPIRPTYLTPRIRTLFGMRPKWALRGCARFPNAPP